MGATDEFGFKALPAGMRDWLTGEFMALQETTYIWSADNNNRIVITNASEIIMQDIVSPNWGCSIRCVKDV